MNTNNFAIKFKRYAVLGISLLGLAAMGCGGGSGTLVCKSKLVTEYLHPSTGWVSVHQQGMKHSGFYRTGFEDLFS